MIKRQATTSDSEEAKSDAEETVLFYYQRCMLAVAYGTTVAVFMINSYITILRCFVANKSTRRSTVLSTLMSTVSRQRQFHDECQSQPSEALFACR
jgi:hypothetical protein